MNAYVYGIVRWPLPAPVPAGAKDGPKSKGKAKRAGAAAALDVKGVGDPPADVRAVRHRDLAALVSDVTAVDLEAQGVRGLRRDMRAHAAVLNHLAGFATVLPFQFGVVLPSEAAVVGRLLEPRCRALVEHLKRLEGAVEVSLKATYVEDRVLSEVVTENPQLGARGGSGRSYQAKMELGRRIAAAIQAKQARDARSLLDVLRPLVRDVRVSEPASDLMVLNASLLVGRDGLSSFDRTLAQLDAEEGHRIKLDCVGPLPPYSFANLSL
jgi:hypothetical protein